MTATPVTICDFCTGVPSVMDRTKGQNRNLCHQCCPTVYTEAIHRSVFTPVYTQPFRYLIVDSLDDGHVWLSRSKYTWLQRFESVSPIRFWVFVIEPLEERMIAGGGGGAGGSSAIVTIKVPEIELKAAQAAMAASEKANKAYPNLKALHDEVVKHLAEKAQKALEKRVLASLIERASPSPPPIVKNVVPVPSPKRQKITSITSSPQRFWANFTSIRETWGLMYHGRDIQCPKFGIVLLEYGRGGWDTYQALGYPLTTPPEGDEVKFLDEVCKLAHDIPEWWHLAW